MDPAKFSLAGFLLSANRRNLASAGHCVAPIRGDGPGDVGALLEARNTKAGLGGPASVKCGDSRPGVVAMTVPRIVRRVN